MLLEGAHHLGVELMKHELGILDLAFIHHLPVSMLHHGALQVTDSLFQLLELVHVNINVVEHEGCIANEQLVPGVNHGGVVQGIGLLLLDLVSIGFLQDPGSSSSQGEETGEEENIPKTRHNSENIGLKQNLTEYSALRMTIIY